MTLMSSEYIIRGMRDAFKKLNPLTLWRNPVMFVVEIGTTISAVFTIGYILSGQEYVLGLHMTIWLLATVLFANFAEALAEIQGKARAGSLRGARDQLSASRITADGKTVTISAGELRKGDVIIIREGESIPGDGDVIEGMALVDESAITGESAPVVRESGGDKCGVTGGTKILSGKITVKITANPGETFLDGMIKMVESARRQKTPNEIALQVLLTGLTALFIVVVSTLPVFAGYMGVAAPVPVLISLLVCLMPTTIGGLLPAIGIAGIDRLLQRNVVALSGRAVEAAGDVDIVLLDKTGTITMGNRMATEFIPVKGTKIDELLWASLYSSLADETPEGRSIVVLAKKELGIHGRDIRKPEGSTFIPFTPETGMSGIDMPEMSIRKGALQAIKDYTAVMNYSFSDDCLDVADVIAMEGCTPLVVVKNRRTIGVIRLKDVVKEGIAARLAALRSMGIQSVMVTGDNPLTASTIAAEAGVDDFLAQAKPEDKLKVIRRYQQDGRLVAMIGDGTNDAPALAQADVAVAMNAGTQAAREAANMIDLDSNPTKLLDIVETGKEILITRGALTTFSMANDVAKYFAIIPALFAGTYGELKILDIMHLSSPATAVLSAVIFNALVIPFLIPLALRGVKYRFTSVSKLLRVNFLVYGAGGVVFPFIGIKLIDLLIAFFSFL